MKRFLFILPFFFLLFLLPAKASAAARFYLSPSSGSYKVGDTITASVMIDTGGQAINAADGSATFTSNILEYQSVSTSGSIFTFWTSGPNGGSTSVSFSGGLPNPGYNGSAGKVLTITWKAKTSGTGTVTINGTKILANDGAGTNIYSSSSGGSFAIGAAATPKPGAPLVRSTTHPDQSKWYSANSVSLNWSGSGVSGYIFALDQTATTDPSGSATATTSKTYESVADGIWYLHVKGKTSSGFTPVSHFRIQIDTQPPDSFSINVNQEGGSTNPTPKVDFEAKDATSGIEKYEASIDGGAPFTITSGDALPKLTPGTHTLLIKAFDKAGNIRESSVTYRIEGISPPVIVDWSKLVGLLNPVSFLGRSDADDTIVVYLGDKEVDRFLAKDKLVPYDRLSDSSRVVAGFGNEIAWEYQFTPILLPGGHAFRFQRIDNHGAESTLTQPYRVQVEAATIKVGNWIFKTNYVIGVLVGIILLLVIILIFLIRKLRRLAKQGGFSLAYMRKRLKQLMAGSERELLHDVDEVVPGHELNAADVRDVKKAIKERIHNTIEQEEKQLDDTKQ